MALRVVRLPAPGAADVVRGAWDAGEAVLVLDPRAPQAAGRPDPPTDPDRPAALYGEPGLAAQGVEVEPEGEVAADQQPVAAPRRAHVDLVHRGQAVGAHGPDDDGGTRPGPAGHEGGAAEPGPGGVVAAHLDAPRPRAHEHAVGVGPVEHEHQGGGERRGKQRGDALGHVLGHGGAEGVKPLA